MPPLTRERPNVYDEIGHAHARNKRVHLFRRTGTKLHFDVAHRNCPEYDNITDLKDQLRKRMAALTNKPQKKLRELAINFKEMAAFKMAATRTDFALSDLCRSWSRYAVKRELRASGNDKVSLSLRVTISDCRNHQVLTHLPGLPFRPFHSSSR